MNGCGEEPRGGNVQGPVKPVLLLLALLGGLWGARSLGGPGGTWDAGPAHTTFYDDGTRRSEATLAQGALNGPARTWHRGGALASEGRYARGEREGAWRFWDEDGSLDPQRSGIYAAGVRRAPLGVEHVPAVP